MRLLSIGKIIHSWNIIIEFIIMIINHIYHSEWIIQDILQVLENIFTPDTLVLCDTRLLIKKEVLPHIPFVWYYDQRILPILKNTNLIVADGVNESILNYFQSLGLAKNVKIFHVPNIPSNTLTEILLENKQTLSEIRTKNFKKLLSLFVDSNVETLAKELWLQCHISSDINMRANNKLLLKKFLIQEGLPFVSGTSSSDLKIIEEYYNMSEEYFFKSPLGVSGYGFWSNKKNTLNEILDQYWWQEIIIEKVIQKIGSPSIQFVIDPSTKNGYIFWLTDQILEDWQHYLGNISPSTFLHTHPEAIKEILFQSEMIINYISSLGYTWFWGIDFMVSDLGEVYATEVNARWTGATYPAISSILLTNSVATPWRYMTYDVEHETINAYLKNSIKSWNERGIFPICIWSLERYWKVQVLEFFDK